MTFAKIENGLLITAQAPFDDEEVIFQIKTDGFLPYDDSAQQPGLGQFQTARPAYREQDGTIYLYWEIIHDSPEKIKAEIARLQAELSATDYKVVKSYEYILAGEPPPYDIEAIHASRQAIRKHINELEGLL